MGGVSGRGPFPPTPEWQALGYFVDGFSPRRRRSLRSFPANAGAANMGHDPATGNARKTLFKPLNAVGVSPAFNRQQTSDYSATNPIYASRCSVTVRRPKGIPNVNSRLLSSSLYLCARRLARDKSCAPKNSLSRSYGASRSYGPGLIDGEFEAWDYGPST